MLTIKIEHFLKYCKVSNFADKSIESLRLRLKGFNKFINDTGIASAKDISYKHLRSFLMDDNPSIHVKKARIWSLRQFFHFLKLNGWVKINIALDLPYPKIEKTVPYFLTFEEYNRLLAYFYGKISDCFGLRNLVLIMILGLLGLRLAAVISLNIESVDIESGLLQVTEKGQNQRQIVMPKVLCLVLDKYLKTLDLKIGPLFLSKRKKRISARTLQDIFKQAADELDIDKHLHAHLFRHTAATHLNKVSDVAITQHVLGHMRSSNTQKYAHLNPDQYAFYMQKHPYVRDFKTPEVNL